MFAPKIGSEHCVAARSASANASHAAHRPAAHSPLRLVPVQLLAALLICFFGACPHVFAQTSVLTQHYDNYRSGANLNETILTPANVNTATFGRLFSTTTDGYAYAQPLYLPGITMGVGTPQAGTTHNVIFIATEHDSVYAFDADSNGGANANPLWQITLLDSAHGAGAGATTVPNGDVSSGDITPEIGITSTPVIDPNSGTIYVVGKTLESGNFVQRLHALDITTGLEKLGGPITLQASVPGTGNGSSGGVLAFDPKWENQRASLLLQNGIVYLGFGAHGDNGPWHGWILAYNAQTLQQTSAFCVSPNGTGGGVWMSGSGLAADIPDPVNHPYGRMLIATGNGSYDATVPYTNHMDYGDSDLRLDLTNGVITVQDDFTPENQGSLNLADNDVASGGVLLLPDQTVGGHTHLLVNAGKEGRIYLVDRDNMGGYSTTADNNVQDIPPQPSTSFEVGGLWSMPAYWNNNVYIWARYDTLKTFALSNGLLSTAPVALSAASTDAGITPAISANGTSNAIVWTLDAFNGGFGQNGVLSAYLASNVSTLLYSSTQNATRDATGFPVKFTIPTVVNGKVYIGVQHAFTVYGLLNGQPQAATPVLTPSSETFTGSVSVSISDSTPGATLYYTTNGATPTTASTPYTGAITVTSTETIKVTASASGYITSPVASATYTLPTQAATPMLTPAPGVYSFAQSVTITSASSGVTIYYTTDGSTPTTASTKYTTPMTINATTTLQAIAAGNGFTASAVAGGLYTIQISSTTANFSAGFAGSSAAITFNGATQLDDTRLQLTDGGANEASSAFLNTPLNIQAFTTTFAFQLSNPAGEGITFTIQGNSPTALGQTGGGLGYGASTTGGTGGIPNSIAVKLDYVSNQGEGTDSTGLYQNGAAPTIPALDMTASGINLMSDDTMSMQLTYDGTTLFMNLTDNVANKSYAASWPLNLPAIVGGSTAYVGFTGATSTLTSSQKIETWTFTSNAPPPKFSLTPGTYLGTQTVTLSDAVSGVTPTIYYTTNGSTPSTSSTKYTGAITISASETINAIAVATGYGNSAVSTAGYVIESQAPAPTFNPVPGTFVTSVSVTLIDSVSGATIYYTTNGNTPTTTSTQYTAPISIGTTTTIKAIAVVSGYFNSNASSGTYTITAAPLAATPAFSPAGGTYGSAQNVIISDTTTGAAIYYTTNGTMPTTSSSLYSGPVTVSASETLEAIAVAPGYTNSNANSASYVIQTGSQTIDFGGGFTSSTGLQLNGNTVLNTTAKSMQLTDSTTTYEAGTVFSATPVNVQTFTTDFSFQVPNPTSNGLTFTIQADSAPTEVGYANAGLGYGGISPTSPNGIPLSVAVKFDFYSDYGEGNDSTGMYTNGASPSTPAVDMTSSGVNLQSGDVFNVHMTYNGTTLAWTITDATTGKSFSTSAPLNIISVVESPTAYVGFTGGTGGQAATQSILSWTYSGTPVAGANIPIVYQTENLPGTTSGPSYGVTDWTGFSNGAGTQFSATQPGDNVTINLNVPTAGNYDVRVGLKASSSRGIMQLSVNGANVGSSVDEYFGNNYSWEEFDLGTVQLTTGSQPFKFAVTGKDAASSAYLLTFDYITLIPTGAALPVAATPTFSPPSGTYTSVQTVTIGDTTSGATIYYSTNGSMPTTSSTQYTSPVSVASTETLEAIAVASGYRNSATASGAYTINLPQTAATPTFSPAAGTYTSVQTVTISETTSGAAIYYTTNGTMPTTSSTKYTSPIFVTSTETLESIAVASGYTNSAVGSAAYTINLPQTAATPTFSPVAGTYSSAQAVTISDTTPGTTIYYTTNGTIPSTSSTKYTVPISVASTETLEAIAVATGYANSAVASAAYTIFSGAPSINFAAGFVNTTGLQLNGTTVWNQAASRLRLTGATTASYQAGSVFSSAPVNVQTFTTSFSFQVTSPAADGLTFTIQADSVSTELGGSNGGLGYGAIAPNYPSGIPLSVAVKFDLYSDYGEGSDSTGIYTNGSSPTIPATDMTASGITLTSGDVFNVQISYNGATLSWTITDSTTGKSFSTSAPLNLLDVIESPTAYVGFTAGTGGNAAATQDILSWTFTGTPVSGAKIPIVYQTENFSGVSSGPPYGVADWSGFSNGAGTQLIATQPGDNVTINLNVLAAATYDVRVGLKSSNARGIMQLSVNGVNVGAPADEYSPNGYSWEEVDLGTVTLAAGSQPFKFTVAGKNAASSAYNLTFDYITLIPQ
jgi:hypothetical protein